MDKKSFSLIADTCLTLLLTSLIVSCSMSGTEVGNPATIVGKVTTSDNKAVFGATVSLLSPKYKAENDTNFILKGNDTSGNLYGEMIAYNSEDRYSVKTNANGEFEIHNVNGKLYNLFVSDQSNSKIVYEKNITIYSDKVNLGTVKLTPARYVFIDIPDSIFYANGYLLISTVPYKTSVDSAGRYYLPIVGDTVSVVYVNPSRDSVIKLVSDRAVPQTGPVDTLDFTNAQSILISPTLEVIRWNAILQSGDTTYFNQDSVLYVKAMNAFSNWGNNTLQYQFFDVTQNHISRWDSTSYYRFPVSSSIVLKVSCRVRSRTDTSVTTNWVPAIIVNVVVNKVPTILSRPYSPVLIDSLVYQGGTRSFKFLVRGTGPADSIPYSYRLAWKSMIDTLGFNYSVWSVDSIQSLQLNSPGHYKIFAQARSGRDTTIASQLSDSLYLLLSP